MANLSALSSMLNFILCHRPDSCGITLDDYGWANVEELISGMTANGSPVTLSALEDIVASDPKRHYSFSGDMTKIRATSGHSFKVNLDISPEKPPEFLFIAVKTLQVNAVKGGGLTGKTALPFELYETPADAKSAIKASMITVLRIKSGRMSDAGHLFYITAKNSYKCSNIPSIYIDFDYSG